jgi:hypothetical protein
MSKFKNMMYLLMLFSSSYCFAQTPVPTQEAPVAQGINMNEAMASIETKLNQAIDEAAGKDGKISLLIRTEDDKLIRVACAYPNCKGTELNSKITKVLLSSGKYEAQNELIPELGMLCKKLSYTLSKDNKLAIGYGEGCQRGS